MRNKQFERLFEMISYLDNGAKEDFVMETGKGKSVHKAKEVQAFVGKSIHNMLTAGYSPIKGTTKAIQAFNGSTDIAVITTNVWNAFQETPNFDMFWQEAFRAVPLRKGQLEWTIGNVTSGVALQLLEEGEKVNYEGISGTNIKGSVDLYGSGLELTWKTIEGRDLAGFYNAMLDFRNKRMKEYADVHYALLVAAGASNATAYDTTGTLPLDKDINTLNTAYNTIGTNCKDKGFGDTANARMILYVSPLLRNRINAALRATSSDVVRGKDGVNTVDSNIDVRYTYNSAIAANTGLMCLPGNKIQNSVYMEEKSFERENPDNLNWLKSSFTAFGAIVGEVAQTSTVSFVTP